MCVCVCVCVCMCVCVCVHVCAQLPQFCWMSTLKREAITDQWQQSELLIAASYLGPAGRELRPHREPDKPD